MKPYNLLWEDEKYRYVDEEREKAEVQEIAGKYK